MNKIIITSILLLLSSSVLSEASIDIHNQQKTYLLTAPGTVTGNNKQSDTRTTTAMPTLPVRRPMPRQRPMRYKYVGESTKFRQFGQEPGQNNPWFRDYNSGYPRQLGPSSTQPITNPWQLGGMPPLRGMIDAGPGAYTSNQSSPYRSDETLGGSNLYPDFPDGIYRDTNPAAFFLPEINKGFMPEFGGDNFGFPFSPFGMF